MFLSLVAGIPAIFKNIGINFILFYLGEFIMNKS